MSDAELPGSPALTPNTQTSGFEAVKVFPDSTDIDLHPDADNCYRCAVCNVSCLAAEVDDELPGPRFQGPE